MPDEQDTNANHDRALASHDQQAKWLGETLPVTWASLYRGLREQGFPHGDAMVLVQTYIHATAGG